MAYISFHCLFFSNVSQTSCIAYKLYFVMWKYFLNLIFCCVSTTWCSDCFLSFRLIAPISIAITILDQICLFDKFNGFFKNKHPKFDVYFNENDFKKKNPFEVIRSRCNEYFSIRWVNKQNRKTDNGIYGDDDNDNDDGNGNGNEIEQKMSKNLKDTPKMVAADVNQRCCLEPGNAGEKQRKGKRSIIDFADLMWGNWCHTLLVRINVFVFAFRCRIQHDALIYAILFDFAMAISMGNPFHPTHFVLALNN